MEADLFSKAQEHRPSPPLPRSVQKRSTNCSGSSISSDRADPCGAASGQAVSAFAATTIPAIRSKLNPAPAATPWTPEMIGASSSRKHRVARCNLSSSPLIAASALLAPSECRNISACHEGAAFPSQWDASEPLLLCQGTDDGQELSSKVSGDGVGAWGRPNVTRPMPLSRSN